MKLKCSEFSQFVSLLELLPNHLNKECVKRAKVNMSHKPVGIYQKYRVEYQYVSVVMTVARLYWWFSSQQRPQHGVPDKQNPVVMRYGTSTPLLWFHISHIYTLFHYIFHCFHLQITLCHLQAKTADREVVPCSGVTSGIKEVRFHSLRNWLINNANILNRFFIIISYVESEYCYDI